MAAKPLSILVVGTVCVAGMPSQAQEVAIQPHRAVYAFSLGQSGAGLTGVDGRLVFQWADRCDAWAVDQHMVFRLFGPDGTPIDAAATYATREAKDGSAFTFSAKTRGTGEPEEEFRGQVVRDAEGAMTVDYRRPDAAPAALPPGTLLPSEHTLETILRAQRGDLLFSALMFDGADEDGLAEVDAVMVPAGPSQEPLMDGIEHRRWLVTLAFRTPGSQSPEPDYQMTIGLMSNGMVDSVSLDYGDFVMDGTLTELELLEDGC